MNSLIICILAGATAVSFAWGLYYLIVDRPNLVSLIKKQHCQLLSQKNERWVLQKELSELAEKLTIIKKLLDLL